MTSIDKPELAARFARAIASDIALYHADAIKQAYAHDELFESLREPILEGRALYKGRISTEFDPDCRYYDYALVDVIYARQVR